MMTASLMSDVVVLQVKCNHSTHVINCCLPYATHRAVCKINRWISRASTNIPNFTYASGALRFKLIPPLSLDKKMSEWASVRLWCISNAEFSFVRMYWFGDCLFNLAMLLISLWRTGRCDRKNDTAFGRSGKLAASWTAIWKSSIVRPPLWMMEGTILLKFQLFDQMNNFEKTHSKRQHKRS